MSGLLANLASAVVLVVIPGMVVVYVFWRERKRYRARAWSPEAVIGRARCAGCGASLVATGLLYVHDDALLCDGCRRRVTVGRRPGLSSAAIAELTSPDRGGARPRRG